MSEQKGAELRYKVGKVGINGTSGQGDLHADYTELVKAFGEPTSLSGDGKTQAEWHLTFEDGLVAPGRDGCADQFRQRFEGINLGGRPLTFVVAVVQSDVPPQVAVGEHWNSHRRLDASRFEKLASGFFKIPDVAHDNLARGQSPQPRLEADVDHNCAVRVLEKGRRRYP